MDVRSYEVLLPLYVNYLPLYVAIFVLLPLYVAIFVSISIANVV